MASLMLLTTLEGLNAIHHFVAVPFDINEDFCLFLLFRFFGGDFNFVMLLALKHFLVTWPAAKCCAKCMAAFFHFSFKASAGLSFLFAFYHFRFSDLQRIYQKKIPFLLFMSVKMKISGDWQPSTLIGIDFQSFAQLLLYVCVYMSLTINHVV